MAHHIRVSTKSRSALIDITADVRRALAESGVSEGICTIFIPHTTAGVTINENADPDVKTDIIQILDTLAPWTAGYRHMEGNSAAHVKASMMGFSVSIPVESGKLVLGIWQCVYFCEFDGPKTRTFIVSVTGS